MGRKEGDEVCVFFFGERGVCFGVRDPPPLTPPRIQKCNSLSPATNTPASRGAGATAEMPGAWPSNAPPLVAGGGAKEETGPAAGRDASHQKAAGAGEEEEGEEAAVAAAEAALPPRARGGTYARWAWATRSWRKWSGKKK